MSTAFTGDRLQVTVLDGAGAPVTGGSVTFEPLQQSGRITGGDFRFVETSSGIYRAPIPGGQGGELHGTIRFSRGDAGISGKVALFN